jgi:[ribosomal protein S5]-alanine N-acetyltransferase
MRSHDGDTMVLELGICSIRSWRPEDTPELARQANCRDVWRNMRDAFPSPFTRADAETFIADARKHRPETRFAIAVDDAPAGGIGFHTGTDIERVGAEIGYWLGAAYWGRGIMSACIPAFSRAVFAQHPELHRLFAVPLAWNTASARVLEKSGYLLEGRMRQSAVKDGIVVDQLLYAMTKEESV